ncbi:MAG TPA: DUF3052 family protein [Gemmatimonadaceae bacterium]|nr:DUF3052 family protein [Gemmatimonadaceae bacterium]
MGLEAMCAVRIGLRRATGKALLESDHVLLRLPNKRIKIPFADITKIETKDGALVLGHKGGSATLYLGLAAAKWADKIKNPRPLLDKLGVKPGMRVSVMGVDDPTFLLQLASRDTVEGGGALDLIFFGTEDPAELVRLGNLKRLLKSDGAIWVVHRKGKDATIRDVDVFEAAKRAGLVDNKVVAFSATHTAERVVIPVKDRV